MQNTLIFAPLQRTHWVLSALLLTACVGNTSIGGADAGGVGALNAPGTVDPGTVVLHRLNSYEYNHTVHDLLGTTKTPADTFPRDDVIQGFSNNAAVLSISPAQMTLYESAAETLATDAADPNGPNYRTLVPCAAQTNKTACLQTVITTFGRQAWRRPLTDGEVTSLLSVAQLASSTDFNQQLQAVFIDLLVSPNFIFRVETDSNPNSTDVHALNDYELASRLSYFLWASTPDATLLDAADAGTLHTDAGLQTQLTRMLADPRSISLINDFAGAWLNINAIKTITPSATVFPTFDENVRASMLSEANAFASNFIMGDAPASELLSANYSYIDDNLAKLYGMQTSGSSTVQRLTLPAGPRRGLLGEAGLLASLSGPQFTSPVKRGKFVMTQLLCASPPPPPPNVGSIDSASNPNATQRQLLEAHVSNPSCAACHNVIDPPGFALEEFDALGRLRSSENGQPINTAATMDSGAAFQNAGDFAGVLSQDARFPTCATTMMLTYATGRTLGAADQTLVNSLTLDFNSQGQRLKYLLGRVVLSPSFRNRRGGAL